MQRRGFLKLAAASVVVSAARLAFPWAAAPAKAVGVSYGGVLYRPGGNGRIMTSADGGLSWTLHSDLGDIYSVSRLAMDRSSRLRATVDFGTRGFMLTLGPDRRSWLTT